MASCSRVGLYLQYAGFAARATIRALWGKARRPCFATACQDPVATGLPRPQSLTRESISPNVKIQVAVADCHSSEAKNPTLGAETLRSAQGTRRDFAIVLPVQGLGRFRSLSLLLTSVEGIIG